MAFKNLTQGIKISISRSITTSFENYMSRIDWEEEKFNLHNFVNEWRDYINNHSSWYSKVSEETKADPAFHEELAAKINETINKILSEKPTGAQQEEIDTLQQELGEEYDYSCKMEAKYVMEKLKAELKKTDRLRPAEEAELNLASILYYQAYQEELPNRHYRKQDIEYIIEQLNVKLTEGKEVFDSFILH